MTASSSRCVSLSLLAKAGRTARWTAAGILSAIVTYGTASAGVPATTANDVCPGLPATCNVTQIYDVTPGATLDFGTSTVNVTGTGQFNFGVNSGTILSGPFTANTANPAIDANGIGTSGTDSGTIKISARRLCTAKTGLGADVPCIDLADCQLGACDTRRCTGRGTLHCVSDATCAGTCTNKHCSNTPTFVRCTANADCNFGTCDTQLQCRNRDVNPVSCASNTDCQFGGCSVGSASITMGGSIVGNSAFPASITLRAADNVTISKVVNLTGSALDSDGGDLTVEAAAGSIVLSGKYNAPSGNEGAGGTLELDAALDVTINESVTVTGGDFDGGVVEINAGRDVFINRSIVANSTGGAGYGGEIFLHADRDLSISGISALNRAQIETSGHTSVDNSSGDGGSHDYSAGRDFSMNQFSRVIGNGAAPAGYGSELTFDVGRNLTLQGNIIAKADGITGQGGLLDAFADGLATIGATGTMDLTGGSDGGGELSLESTEDATVAGTINVGASAGGAGGFTFVYSDANATVSGSLLNNAVNGGGHEVDACRTTLAGTGKIGNTAANGTNKLVSRESMKLLAGSSMTTGSLGKNVLEYRTAAKQPLRQGTITPAPQLVLDPNLVGCPVCGNGEIDQTETCDDGNTASGDTCSSTCQNENCVAQTGAPGYPAVPLCDDGDACTTDTCNTALAGGTCEHSPKTCSDSLDCTADSCEAATGNCKHVANNSLCNDGNPCSNDFCSELTGCASTPNTDPCNDGSSCTQNDVCIAKVCTGTPIEGCGVCGDGVATGDEECDDGNTTYVNGEYCAAGCTLVACGDTNNSKTITSGDALFTLRAAVSQATCHLRVCDVDGTTKINASDALRVLRKAVQLPVELNCPTS